MCTIGFHKDLNLIFKNRDKAKETLEEIVIDEDYLGVKTRGTDYLSCGVNNYRCGFVSAAVNSPAWTALVARGKTQKANEQFLLDNRGLDNPMVLVSEILPNVKNINEIIDKIRSCGLSWMGYNILLVDTKQALAVEVHRSDIYLRALGPREVMANHFLSLEYGPKKYLDYPSSFRRYAYGNRKVRSIASLAGLFEMLKPGAASKKGIFWRSGKFKTISSSIIDLKKRLIYYSRDLNEDYSVYGYT